MSSPKPSPPATKAVPPESRRSRRSGPPDLSALEGAEEESFKPAANQIAEGPDHTIRYIIMGVTAVFLLFGVYVVLSAVVSHFASSSTPTPPPAPIRLNAPVAPPSDDTVSPVAPVAPMEPLKTTTVTTTRPAASQPAWVALRPAVPTLSASAITDDSVGKAIKAGVKYLKSRFANDQLLEPKNTDLYAGENAICTYALLNAGKAIDDSDLSVSSPFMQGLLDHLHTYPMTGEFATYCRSLRICAYSIYDRDVDRDQLNKDRDWLLKSAIKGAYDYTMVPANTPPQDIRFDNSNSQYGVLGIWAAADLGLPVPDKYWLDVEQHWLGCREKAGGWDYYFGNTRPTLTMTCAGITTLCVTAEQQELIASKGKRDAKPQLSDAVNSALDWVGTGDNLLSIEGHPGYTLYGVERAALATGFRWFGNHDWYRELGADVIRTQQKDGSWVAPYGSDPIEVEAAFRLLFLSRGRQPLLMDKLRFDGDWNDRPRDVAKLTQFASKQLEKPFAWGVADLSRNWWDWLESPLLMISTDSYPQFSDEDCKKLRSYTDAGGLIFVHNEYASKEVDSFVANLAERVYPDYPMKKMGPDDPIYSSVFPMKTKPVLGVIGNGARPFLIYSPKDLTQDWVRYRPRDGRQNLSMQFGLNLFVTAAGKTDFRNRLNSPYEVPADNPPLGTVPVLQVSYAGSWNPEPKALELFPRWFQRQTSLKLDVKSADLASLPVGQAPVAIMTGIGPVDFSKMDLRALHDFVIKGSVLVVDSTGGDKAFAASVSDLLLPAAFPGIHPVDLPAGHPIIAGTGPCMDRIPKPRLRSFASAIVGGSAPNVQYAEQGRGAIIVTDLDLTTGLLNASTYAINGYTAAYSRSLMKNVILWAAGRSVQ